MNKTRREQMRPIVRDVKSWIAAATAAESDRVAVEAAARESEERLRKASVTLSRAGQPAWKAIALGTRERSVVDHLAARANLPPLTPDDLSLLRHLAGDASRAIADIAPLLGARRWVTGSGKKETAAVAADFLARHHSWMHESGAVDRLDRLGRPVDRVQSSRMGFEDLLRPVLGLDLLANQSDPEPQFLLREDIGGLTTALQTIAKALDGEAEYREAARHAGEAVRTAEVDRILREMPVDALKTATRDRLRLGPLTGARITSIHDVLTWGMRLQTLPGVGETTARRMLGAAQTLRQVTLEEMPIRIDVSHRHNETTELLAKLTSWDTARQTRGATADLQRADELRSLVRALSRDTTHVLVIPTRGLPVSELRDGIAIVKKRAALLRNGATAKGSSVDADPWDEFLSRPADYFAMLSELGFVTEDEEAVHGDLPEEIIQAVRDQPLSGEHLTASLRGYQSFAARFALVQRKVVIGDEMGLGKTVEALAVLAHLRSRGDTHFVVVCPAAVVTNWMREVTGKSRLRAHRVHGPDRERAARIWARDGGVAVTTYETLAWWEPGLARVRDLACVVVDEAHYIKNPSAQRSIRASTLVDRSERAILLTGTPLENRVEEFRNLVSYLRPDLTLHASDLSPRTFRRQIAPAYLRRNQEDVLTELPELIEVDEWMPMSQTDQSRYRGAVMAGNFMAMRQAAMLSETSEKVGRLVEIVREAEENHRRVIVFSHFRDVLDLVARSLPGQVFGPLSGSVAANQRQLMVDRFSAADHGAVLVAQIVAGGVGLNIQSASVVVICEPQLKPTTEAQAIARAHRMGQVQSVQVHRLLSEDSVDQRITELLAGKQALFDEFARVSDTANSTPDAVDLSEAELVRDVIAAERMRLRETAAAEG